MSETLYLDVLEGSHLETAFLEITVNDECITEQVAPLIFPKQNPDDTMSLLVNHIDAVYIRRQQVANFFAEKIDDENDKVDSRTMLKRLNHHGLLFLDMTGSYLSKNLPFYTADFV